MKVPCSSCGTMIMPETAQRTGGVCMPCKSGTRATMDASRAAVIRERELDATDPFRLHWRKLNDKVNGTPSGLDQLSGSEAQYWAVNRLSAEVHNGGFHQYFFNSSGAGYLAALRGLEAMQAFSSLSLLVKAKQMLFGFQDVPADTAARRRILEAADSPSLQRRFDELDKQFWQDPEQLADRIEAFAIRHGLVQLPAPDLSA